MPVAMGANKARKFMRFLRTLDSFTDGQVKVTKWDEDDLDSMTFAMSPGEPSAYAGGTVHFEVYMNCPDPPTVTCTTKIYHPNIDPTCTNGNVCLSLFDEWQPTFGLEDVVQGLLFLLYEPNPDDALSPYFHGNMDEDGDFEENVMKTMVGEGLDGVDYDCVRGLDEQVEEEHLVVMEMARLMVEDEDEEVQRTCDDVTADDVTAERNMNEEVTQAHTTNNDVTDTHGTNTDVATAQNTNIDVSDARNTNSDVTPAQNTNYDVPSAHNSDNDVAAENSNDYVTAADKNDDVTASQTMSSDVIAVQTTSSDVTAAHTMTSDVTYMTQTISPTNPTNSTDTVCDSAQADSDVTPHIRPGSACAQTNIVRMTVRSISQEVKVKHKALHVVWMFFMAVHRKLTQQ